MTGLHLIAEWHRAKQIDDVLYARLLKVLTIKPNNNLRPDMTGLSADGLMWLIDNGLIRRAYGIGDRQWGKLLRIARGDKNETT